MASGDSPTNKRKRKRKNQRVTNRMMSDTSIALGTGSVPGAASSTTADSSAINSQLRTSNGRSSLSTKARSLMNLHNNEAGRRVSSGRNSNDNHYYYGPFQLLQHPIIQQTTTIKL